MTERAREVADLRLRRRRELRQRSTKPEQLLWWALRNRRQGGLKFRRQHPIGAYIVDFVCVENRLVVELDGGYHDYVVENDAIRQRYLEEQGYMVIRFLNEDILDDLDAVVTAIAKAATDRSTPSP